MRGKEKEPLDSLVYEDVLPIPGGLCLTYNKLTFCLLNTLFNTSKNDYYIPKSKGEGVLKK